VRIADEILAERPIGERAVGGQEGLGLAGVQPMAPHGLREVFLGRLREARECQGHGHRELAGIEPGGEFGRESAREDLAPLDPAPAMSEQLGDGAEGQPIV